MSAESYTEIFNFEENIESAFRQWLGDQMLEVQEQLGLEALPDDYIGVTANMGAITGHYNPSPGGAAHPTYDQYNFDLNFVVQTRRHNEEGSQTSGVKSRHRELVALLRTWVSLFKIKGSTLETYLDYYEIQFLRPSGTANDVEDVFDVTTVSYEGQISILTNAFPTV